jgi:xanthine dehydrogenase accessory factor
MKNKYFNSMLENLPKGLERRTAITGKNLGCEAIYDLGGNFVSSSDEGIKIDDCEYMSEIISGKLELVICGGGHVGHAVYELGLFLGMNVTIVEDREEFCNKDLYPKATLKIGKYDEVLDGMELSHSAIVVATRGHKFDRTCVQAILPKRYRYLGMIGSSGKVATTRGLLSDDIESGKIDAKIEKLETLHAPIGLDINAQTPEEIAVSILSEIIKVTKSDKKQVQIKVSDLEKLLKTDEPFVVARIIEKKGSAPREVGSFLAILSDGSMIGTVGGGAMEAVVIHDCKKLLKNENQTSAIFEHDLSNKNARNLGMICGGDEKVILHKFIS